MRRDAQSGAIDLHAEADCITQAARRGIPLEGKAVYITSAPCARCLPLILGAGIVRIFHSDPLTKYIGKHNEQWARQLLIDSKCELFEDVERPSYKQIAVNTRTLAPREAAVEERIDLEKLVPRKKRRITDVPDKEEAP
ncbi:CMP/dCMP deaminase [Hondaea fermentalgiana]|uniref:CMP/dCMP deaminase n=1 Tax=Hondaea fermentalgiana TaxID=2315210 RepID=A0A2R5GWQ0_9STRA|nr:CMP/dCMP deaminase [Hondaea fermentalgiana]|eukprot:GBG33093.1 CMP/dCMP deaminase [Hondaea fermentalgiana]